LLPLSSVSPAAIACPFGAIALAAAPINNFTVNLSGFQFIERYSSLPNTFKK